MTGVGKRARQEDWSDTKLIEQIMSALCVEEHTARDMLTEYLDEEVHDVKSEEASVINNEGLWSQVEFLRESGYHDYDFDRIFQCVIEDATEEENEDDE
jgi:hypothetical protein